MRLSQRDAQHFRQFGGSNKWFLSYFPHNGLLIFSDLFYDLFSDLFYDLFSDPCVSIIPIPHCDNLFLSVECDKDTHRISTELRGIHLGFLHARHNFLNAASPRFNKPSQVKCVGNILITRYRSFKEFQLVFVQPRSFYRVVFLALFALILGDALVYLRDGGLPLALHLQQFRRVAVGEVLAEFLLEGLELLAQLLVLLRHFLHLFGAGGAVNLFDGVGHVLAHLVGEVFGRLPLAGGERLDALNEVAVFLPDFLLVGGDLAQADEFVLLEELLHLLLEVLPFGPFLLGDILGRFHASATAAIAAVGFLLDVGDHRVKLVADPRGVFN